MDDDKVYTFDEWFEKQHFERIIPNDSIDWVTVIAKHAWNAAIESAARIVDQEECIVGYRIGKTKAE